MLIVNPCTRLEQCRCTVRRQPPWLQGPASSCLGKPHRWNSPQVAVALVAEDSEPATSTGCSCVCGPQGAGAPPVDEDEAEDEEEAEDNGADEEAADDEEEEEEGARRWLGILANSAMQ